MLPMANSNVSPSAMVLEAVMAPCHKRLPEVEASKMPICVMVPQLPPAAVKVTAPELEVVPPGEDAASKATA
jgi:hypothetical protein